LVLGQRTLHGYSLFVKHEEWVRSRIEDEKETFMPVEFPGFHSGVVEVFVLLGSGAALLDDW